jgi:hypothetical protein
MTEEALLAAVREIAEGLKSDLSGSLAQLDEKCSSLADSVAKLKADAIVSTSQGMENDMRRRGALKSDNFTDDNLAEQTAADRARSDSVDPAAFASLSRSVSELTKKMTRPLADRNAFADVQAKADAVMRSLGTQAEPPMAGEDIVSYNIRLARKMQPHSAKWKGVELGIIAADSKAFEIALDQIRSDAMQAGNSPVGLKPFEYREIVEETKGGHRITRFVGNGSIFKQLSRLVRNVAYIGTRNVAQL